jgi:hypothetical protein
MDLRVYYRKIREVESGLSGEFVVLVSKDTPDGGKAGVLTEVPRYQAAKLIVEDKARAATEAEVREFRGLPPVETEAPRTKTKKD